MLVIDNQEYYIGKKNPCFEPKAKCLLLFRVLSCGSSSDILNRVLIICLGTSERAPNRPLCLHSRHQDRGNVPKLAII